MQRLQEEHGMFEDTREVGVEKHSEGRERGGRREWEGSWELTTDGFSGPRAWV